VLDRDGAVSRSYRLHALPSTFIVDRKGMIRDVIYGGPLSEATLLSKIDRLLAEES
jgi:cytochrome c biogenesis protein CcmG, thiol:disulfide interchange protein DsbE